jgi:hypothetical protein
VNKRKDSLAEVNAKPRAALGVVIEQLEDQRRKIAWNRNRRWGPLQKWRRRSENHLRALHLIRPTQATESRASEHKELRKYRADRPRVGGTEGMDRIPLGRLIEADLVH